MFRESIFKNAHSQRKSAGAKTLAMCMATTTVSFVLSQPSHAGLYDTTLNSLSGLISHWDLNETSGTTAADSVTTDLIDGNNAGVFIGSGITLGTEGPRPSNGWSGFDATNNAPTFGKTIDQKLEMFNVSGYTGLTDLTMLGWMNITDPDFTANSNIFGGLQKDTGARYNYAINSYPGNSLGGFVSRDDGGNVQQLNVSGTPSSVGINEWRFLAMTFESGTTAKLYLNGVEADTRTGEPLGLFAPVTMAFANDIGDTARALQGQLDELAMFDRALTKSEIESLFVAAGGTLPPPPGSTATAPYVQTASNLGGLRNHWNFAETSGTTAADMVAGNNGTITKVLGTSYDLNVAGPSPTDSIKGSALAGMPSGNSAVQFPGSAGINYMETLNGQTVGDPNTGLDFSGGISELTMSAWVNIDSSETGYLAGFSENESSRYVFSMLNSSDSSLGFYVKTEDGSQLVSPAVNLSDSSDWHHVVQVWEGAERNLRVYIDGQPAYSAFGDPETMSMNIEEPEAFFIGYDLHGFTRAFEGSVDEVMLFDKALTDEEAFELFDSAFFAGSGVLPGDFNNDGMVDGDDLTDPVDGWEARYGAAVNGLDGFDFLTWQRNLGATASISDASTAASSEVPEPGAVVLWLFAGMSLALLSRRG